MFLSNIKEYTVRPPLQTEQSPCCRMGHPHSKHIDSNTATEGFRSDQENDLTHKKKGNHWCSHTTRRCEVKVAAGGASGFPLKSLLCSVGCSDHIPVCWSHSSGILGFFFSWFHKSLEMKEKKQPHIWNVHDKVFMEQISERLLVCVFFSETGIALDWNHTYGGSFRGQEGLRGALHKP